MEKTAEILTRINREDYLAYVSTPDLTEQQWEEILADAELAEQILNFTDEEKWSWENHLVDLRKKAQELMGDAPSKAWDNLIQGEVFELNPERYWKRVITDLEAKKATRDAIESDLAYEARRMAAVTEAFVDMYLLNNPREDFL